jgi:hypothetical protein
MKITKKQQIRINRLTKKYGMNERQSCLEKEGDFYFKSAYGNGYAYIQRNGVIEAGNL